jgi:hypothetical protein
MRIAALFILSALAFSCKKSDETFTDNCSVEITHALKNPYAVPSSTMRIAHPSHYYTKFYLYNIEQYRDLESKGVFLLDHPFDAVPDKNYKYIAEHGMQYGVYYGVVPYGTDVSSYQSERLSPLYMEEHSNGRIADAGDRQISGTVTFFDPVDSAIVPLKGVKVIIKDVTRIASAVTDSFGNFNIASPLIISDTVEVLLKFDNDYLEIHTLDLANLSGVFGTNIYSMGFKKSCAFTDMKIEVGRQFRNSALHHSCAALHALNQYYKFAAHYGFLMPDKKFLFWIAREAPLSSHFATPMLRNMSIQNIQNPTDLLTNLIGVPPDLAGILALLVKDQLPDLYAPFYNVNATAAKTSFVETMFHELSHASHYAKVGAAYWMPYVQYIYAHGGYGEPGFSGSGRISLSEAWAEDLSNIGLNYIYEKQKYITLNENNPPYWIPYGLYHDLYDDANEAHDGVSGISFKSVYDLFAVDVNDLAALKAKLELNHPSQQAAIDTLFHYYGY